MLTDPRFKTSVPDSASRAQVMIVDDDRITRLQVAALLETAGYGTSEHSNGLSAHQALLHAVANSNSLPDAIVLDRNMPELDGMALLARLKTDVRLAQLPIVMLTGSDEPQHIREGISAGVFYYLVKPLNPVMLPAIVAAAVDENRRRQSLMATMSRQHGNPQDIEILQLSCNTLVQAEQAATLLAACFPQPQRVLPGVVELLTNAIEHGLLGIGYQTKSQLLKTGQWLAEVHRRESLPDNTTRQVRALFQRGANGTCRLTIADPGAGFAWRNYLELAPDRASDNHGRGIARARAGSFHRLVYNAAGNAVVAEADLDQGLEW